MSVDKFEMLITTVYNSVDIVDKSFFNKRFAY